MGIVVIGASFMDIKGFPQDAYLPTGRNVGRIEYVHGGVARNVVEDIANVELRPTFLGIVDDTPMGAAVLKNAEQVLNDDGTFSFVPNANIFLAAWIAGIVLIPLLWGMARREKAH